MLDDTGNRIESYVQDCREQLPGRCEHAGIETETRMHMHLASTNTQPRPICRETRLYYNNPRGEPTHQYSSSNSLQMVQTGQSTKPVQLQYIAVDNRPPPREGNYTHEKPCRCIHACIVVEYVESRHCLSVGWPCADQVSLVPCFLSRGKRWKMIGGIHKKKTKLMTRRIIIPT